MAKHHSFLQVTCRWIAMGIFSAVYPPTNRPDSGRFSKSFSADCKHARINSKLEEDSSEATNEQGTPMGSYPFITKSSNWPREI